MAAQDVCPACEDPEVVAELKEASGEVDLRKFHRIVPVSYTYYGIFSGRFIYATYMQPAESPELEDIEEEGRGLDDAERSKWWSQVYEGVLPDGSTRRFAAVFKEEHPVHVYSDPKAAETSAYDHEYGVREERYRAENEPEEPGPGDMD